MTTTLNNSYLVKVSTKGEGVKIAQNSVHVVCTCPLGSSPALPGGTPPMDDLCVMSSSLGAECQPCEIWDPS